MGTKAVLAIASKNKGKHYTRIIGCTSDGHEENLVSFAQTMYDLACKHRCLTKFKQNDPVTVSRVQDLLVRELKDWVFVDKIENAEWVSHSAIYNPKTDTIEIYEGLLENLRGTATPCAARGFKPFEVLKTLKTS